jgi:hypothetical protein
MIPKLSRINLLTASYVEMLRITSHFPLDMHDCRLLNIKSSEGPTMDR